MSKRSPESEQQAFCELLKAIRNEAGLTQQALADRLDLPQSFVSKYESGERRLDVLELRAVCGGLGLTLVEFASRLEASLT